MSAIVGCTENPHEESAGSLREVSFTDEELLVLTNYLNPPSISESEAVANALEAVALLDGETRTAQRSVKRISVLRGDGLHTRSNGMLLDTMAYVVNFADDAGFAVISHSARIPTVLAISDEGNLSLADTADHPGLKVFFGRLPRYYQMQLAQADSLESTLLDDVLHKLAEKVDSDANGAVGTRGLPGAGIIGGEGCQVVYGRWYAKSKVSPLLTTHWHQRYPYNQDTPMVGDNHTLVGCVAIAAGQIMAYHQKPNLLWDIIYMSSDVEMEYSKLLHAIGTKVGMNYGLQSSTAKGENVPSCLTSYNYDCGPLRNYTIYDMNTSLLQNCPIYVQGRSSTGGGMHGFSMEIFLWSAQFRFLRMVGKSRNGLEAVGSSIAIGAGRKDGDTTVIMKVAFSMRMPDHLRIISIG